MRSIPSASTTQSCGEPTHSRQTNSVVARSSGEVAPPERLHALHEPLLGAGGEEDHAHALRRAARGARAPGPRARPPRSGCRSRPAPPGCAPMSAIAAVAPPRRRSRPARSQRRPSRPQSATSSGPRKTPKRIGTLWFARSCSFGTSRMPIRGSAGWNTRPVWAASWWAMKTTVRAASGSPGLGHDVPGRAVRQRRAGTRAARRSRRRRPRPRPPRPRPPRAARPSSGGERGGGVQQPERPPVAAVGALLLDPHVAAAGVASSPASHSAARRSPAEAEGRSKEASSRTTRSIRARRHGRRQPTWTRTRLARADPLERRRVRAEQEVEAARRVGVGEVPHGERRSKLDEAAGSRVSRARTSRRSPPPGATGRSTRSPRPSATSAIASAIAGQRRRACRAARGRPKRSASAWARNVPPGATSASQARPRSRSLCFWWPELVRHHLAHLVAREVVDQVVVEHHPLGVAEPVHVGVRARWCGGSRPRGRPGPRPPRARSASSSTSSASCPGGSGSKLLKSGSITTGKSQMVTTPKATTTQRPPAPTSGAGSAAPAPGPRAPPIAAHDGADRRRLAPRPDPVRPDLGGQPDVAARAGAHPRASGRPGDDQHQRDPRPDGRAAQERPAPRAGRSAGAAGASASSAERADPDAEPGQPEQALERCGNPPPGRAEMP